MDDSRGGSMQTESRDPQPYNVKVTTTPTGENAKVDSFSALFCDNCHNLLYPTRKQEGSPIIYMCKVCFQEKEYDPRKAPLFFTRSIGANQSLARTNILPQSRWGFDITLKRIRLHGTEYVIILDGNMQQTLLRDELFRKDE